MSSDPLIGQQLANFRLEHVLGRGGMAQVYYGRDLSLQRPVAIKVIDARFRDEPSYAQRFIQEARSIATWRHENIVQIYYADSQSELYYFVMEYVDGLDLSGLLKQYKREGTLMPHEDVIRIGKAVASALDYAHQKGVIHRDVKPSNIMVSTENRVVLMDFGLAMNMAQGSMGEVFGTPHYIAPEQARNSADAVPQSDLYALGVILYEMLAGDVPFNDPSPTAVALMQVTEEPPPPSQLNPTLNLPTEKVLLKALHKKPAGRYQSGHDLMTALEEALGNRSTATLDRIDTLGAAQALGLSPVTVTERLRLHQRHTPTNPAYDDPMLHVPTVVVSAPKATQPTRQTTQPKTGSRRGLIVGVVLLLLVVIVAAALLLLGGGDDDPLIAAETATPTETLTPTDTPTSVPTATVEPTTAVPASDTPIPTNTSAPPSSTPIPPSSTPVPTTAVPTASPTVATLAPTVLYPNGRRMIFYYDENSFYIYNASGASSRLDEFGFQRLTTDNQITDELRGSRFAQFAPGRQISAGWCVDAEIIDAPAYLRPSVCEDRNSRVTPTREGVEVFWTQEAGSTQFRVLWDSQEVGRCEIGAGICEVNLP
jgi:serine/threonine protein kinase